ncbi:MAG: hypothetical protein ACKORL_04885, partial [Phycisphaerales bacterium]
ILNHATARSVVALDEIGRGGRHAAPRATCGPRAGLHFQGAEQLLRSCHDAAGTAGQLREMIEHGSWLRRLVGTMRLERPNAPGAAERLTAMCVDPDPRVRSAAVFSLMRVGAPPNERMAAAEEEPRVVRTMLRCGWPVPADRVERGARALERSASSSDRLLAVELLGALSAQGRSTPKLDQFARETLASVIARLDRSDGGSLSPRIAAVTGAPSPYAYWRWRTWLDRNRGSLRTDRGMLAGPDARPLPGNPLAELDDARFVKFTDALDALFRKPVDLGVAIDCTASMSGELGAAQSGIDDLMRFVNAATAGMRVAEADDAEEARTRLWKLSAEGGGDEPELVYEAMKLAYGSFSWRTQAQQVMVLIGDAPPHPGWGGGTVDLARAARARGIVTHVISARDPKRPDEVKHFPEIARGGGIDEAHQVVDPRLRRAE